MIPLPDAPLTLITGLPNAVTRQLVMALEARDPELELLAVVTPEQREVAEPLLQAHRRLTLLDGDAAAIDFGLSGAEYAAVAERVTRIFHFSSECSAALTEAALQRANVGAMREVLELGRMCRRLSRIVVGSSTLVSGRHFGTFRESDLQVNQSFRNRMEETLAIAERMARQRMDALPICVVRPSHVVGDARTGEFDAFTGPYPFIALILGAPQDLPLVLPTRGDERVNVVPSDYVAAAAVHVGCDPDAAGRTFHLVDEDPPTVRRLYELVAERAGKRAPNASLPANLTSAILKTPGVSFLSKNQSAFLDVVRTRVEFDTSNTRAWIGAAGIDCPPFDSYVGLMVDHVRRRLDRRTVDGPSDPGADSQ